MKQHVVDHIKIITTKYNKTNDIVALKLTIYESKYFTPILLLSFSCFKVWSIEGIEWASESEKQFILNIFFKRTSSIGIDILEHGRERENIRVWCRTR